VEDHKYTEILYNAAKNNEIETPNPRQRVLMESWVDRMTYTNNPTKRRLIAIKKRDIMVGSNRISE